MRKYEYAYIFCFFLAKESCDIRRLVFNGNYNCSGDSQALTCTLKCPSGMNFQTEPAAHYVCLYETGVFQPSDVPKCIFSECALFIRLPAYIC